MRGGLPQVPLQERELAVRFDRNAREYSRFEDKIDAEITGHSKK